MCQCATVCPWIRDRVCDREVNCFCHIFCFSLPQIRRFCCFSVYWIWIAGITLRAQSFAAYVRLPQFFFLALGWCGLFSVLMCAREKCIDTLTLKSSRLALTDLHYFWTKSIPVLKSSLKIDTFYNVLVLVIFCTLSYVILYITSFIKGYQVIQIYIIFSFGQSVHLYLNLGLPFFSGNFMKIRSTSSALVGLHMYLSGLWCVLLLVVLSLFFVPSPGPIYILTMVPKMLVHDNWYSKIGQTSVVYI